MKKTIKNILAVIMVFVIGIGCTYAEVPSTMSLSSATKLPDYLDSSYHVTMRKNNSGQFIYCLDFGKHNPGVGATFSKGRELDAGIAYIMANGYPNKSYTGDANKDYYITQSALWWYQGNFNGGKNLGITNKMNNGSYGNNDVATYIKTLYNGAVSARNSGYVNPIMKLNTNSVTLHLDGEYYISDLISVTTTGNVASYNVTLNNAPSGSFVVGENGNTINNVREGFYIKVPKSSITNNNVTFSANVNAIGVVNKAYAYNPSNSYYQDMVNAVLYGENINLNSNLDISIISNGVKISKQDITSGKEVPGAKLTVKDSTGKVIDSWISTDTEHYIYNLEDGKYTLTEEMAPEGYELSSETITFEIVNGAPTSTVVMFNKKKQEEVVEETKTITETKEYVEVIETKRTSSSSTIFYIICGLVTLAGSLLVYKYKYEQK